MSKQESLKPEAEHVYECAVEFLDEKFGAGFAKNNPAMVLEMMSYIERLRTRYHAMKMAHELEEISKELWGIRRGK